MFAVARFSFWTTLQQSRIYISGGPRLDSYGGPKALPTFRSPIVYN